MRPLVALLAVAIIGAAFAARTDAHRRGPIHNAKHIAALVYGPHVCGDTLAVPVRRVNTPGALGIATYTIDEDGKRADCSIQLDDQPMLSWVICTVLAHEFGHLAGFDHSTSPDGARASIAWIMWPLFRGKWEPCARRFAAYAVARR